MDRKEQRKLVKELLERISSRKEEPEFYGRQVYKEKTIFNGKYLSKEEENMLVALKDFIRLNPTLTKEEIMGILNANKKRFKFLLDCEARYSDFFISVTNSLGALKHRIAYDRRSDEVLAKKLP